MMTNRSNESKIISIYREHLYTFVNIAFLIGNVDRGRDTEEFVVGIFVQGSLISVQDPLESITRAFVQMILENH